MLFDNVYKFNIIFWKTIIFDKFAVTGSWWLCIQSYIDLWKWTIIQSDKDKTMDYY